MISASDLISKFRFAFDNKWGYIWGTAGILWTEAKQKQKVDYMVSKYGTNWKSSAEAKEDTYYYSAYYGSQWIGHYVVDCSGLFRWAYEQLGSDIAHGSNSIWRGYCSARGALKNGNRTDGKTLLPGSAVFTGTENDHGHIGLYVGYGIVIEASGTKVGVIESKVTDKKWTWWGELKEVDYQNVDPGPEPEPSPQPTTKPTIRKGGTGEYVTELQTDLVKLGYDIGTYGPEGNGIDGKFGAKTETAVKAFQKSKGLTEDGICGPKTWAALDAAVEPEPGPEPEKRYTVTIPHLTEAQAEELMKTWPGATKAEE